MKGVELIRWGVPTLAFLVYFKRGGLALSLLLFLILLAVISGFIHWHRKVRIPTMPAGDSNRSRPLIPTQAGHPSEGVERGWGIMGSVRSGRSSPGCRACAATRPGA